MANNSRTETRGVAGTPLPADRARLIPVLPFGIALSVFFILSFTLCVLSYLVLPEVSINHSALSIFLPGFKLLTWGSYFLGLVESAVYGWYIALVFGPIYNFCVTRFV